jgi:hypothetical protein
MSPTENMWLRSSKRQTAASKLVRTTHVQTSARTGGTPGCVQTRMAQNDSRTILTDRPESALRQARLPDGRLHRNDAGPADRMKCHGGAAPRPAQPVKADRSSESIMRARNRVTRGSAHSLGTLGSAKAKHYRAASRNRRFMNAVMPTTSRRARVIGRRKKFGPRRRA